MNTAQFIDVFYPHIDGVVTTVDNYARFLNREGNKSLVFAPYCGEDARAAERGYETIHSKSLRFVWGYYLPLTAFSRSMKKQAAKLPLDLVHAHSPFTIGHYALKLAKERDIPLVCTFHSKYYDDFLKITHSKLIAEQLTNYVLRLYNKADSVWAVSPGTASTLRDYGFKGEITVMNNGCDAFEGDKTALESAARAKFGLPEKGKNLLFVGNQIWKKNIKLILDTLSILAPEGYRLISVGNGDDYSAIKKYAAKTGAADSVIFTGKIAERDLLAGVYLASDLLFFPSMYDNAPLVLREASTLAVPSMLLAGSNSADCVTEGENGFICPDDPAGCAEAIRRAFADRKKLCNVGIAASQSISVPWENAVLAAKEKYKEIIRDHKKRF